MKGFIGIVLNVFLVLGMFFASHESTEQENIIDTKEVNVLTNEDYSKLYTLRNDERKSNTEIVELDQEDAWLLMQLAVHETGDYGAESQYFVMMVIINRLRSDEFPNTIREVLLQKNPIQFLPEEILVKQVPNADSHIALAMVEQGIDNSQGAIYYEASTNSSQSWHCQNREFLFEAYGQRYYK